MSRISSLFAALALEKRAGFAVFITGRRSGFRALSGGGESASIGRGN